MEASPHRAAAGPSRGRPSRSGVGGQSPNHRELVRARPFRSQVQPIGFVENASHIKSTKTATLGLRSLLEVCSTQTSTLSLRSLPHDTRVPVSKSVSTTERGRRATPDAYRTACNAINIEDNRRTGLGTKVAGPSSPSISHFGTLAVVGSMTAGTSRSTSSPSCLCGLAIDGAATNKVSSLKIIRPKRLSFGSGFTRTTRSTPSSKGSITRFSVNTSKSISGYRATNAAAIRPM